MEVRITPEPEAREPVLAAVEALLSRDSAPPAYRSGWRRLGVLENVGEAEDQGETGRPLSKRGAMRA